MVYSMKQSLCKGFSLHTVHNVHVPLLLVAGVGTKGPETADEVFTPVDRLVFTERRVEGLHFDHVGQLP